MRKQKKYIDDSECEKYNDDNEVGKEAPIILHNLSCEFEEYSL